VYPEYNFLKNPKLKNRNLKAGLYLKDGLPSFQVVSITFSKFGHTHKFS